MATHTAYTVDRRGTLEPGLVIDRVRHRDVEPATLQHHVDALFPAGVTEHGNAYLVTSSRASDTSPNLELIYEYVRRAAFPEAPSRFESVFACSTVAEALAFDAAPGWGVEGARIFEVECAAEPFRADMSCMQLTGSILVVSREAHRYWSGQPNGLEELGAPPTPPFWELLLRPPVRVVREIAG